MDTDMPKKRKKLPIIKEREFSQRPFDGNVNIWERTMGRFGWTEWTIVKVLVKGR